MSFIFPHSLYVRVFHSWWFVVWHLDLLGIPIHPGMKPIEPPRISSSLLMHLLAVSVPCSLAVLFSSVDVKLNPTCLCFLSWITYYKDERSCVSYYMGKCFPILNMGTLLRAHWNVEFTYTSTVLNVSDAQFFRCMPVVRHKSLTHHLPSFPSFGEKWERGWIKQ